MRFISHQTFDNHIYIAPKTDHFMHMTTNSTTINSGTSLSLSFVLQNALIPVAVVVIIFATTYGLWIYKSPNARKERRKCINFYYYVHSLLFGNQKEEYQDEDKYEKEQLTQQQQQLHDSDSPGSPKTKTKQFSLMQKMKESVQMKNSQTNTSTVPPDSLSNKRLRGTANITLEDLECGGSLTNRSQETSNHQLQSASDQQHPPLTERSRFTLFFFNSSKSRNNSNSNLGSTSNKKRDFSKSAHVVVNSHDNNHDRPVVRETRALSKSTHSYIPNNSNHHHHRDTFIAHHHHTRSHHPVTTGGKILAHQPLVPTSLFPSQKRKNSTAVPYEPSSDVMSNLDSDHNISPSTSSKSNRNKKFDVTTNSLHNSNSSTGGGGGGGFSRSISSGKISNKAASNKSNKSNRPAEVSRADVQSALYESRDDVLAANSLYGSRSKTSLGIKNSVRVGTNGLGGIDERLSSNGGGADNRKSRERQIKSPCWKLTDNNQNNNNLLRQSNQPNSTLSSSARLKLSSFEMLQKQSSAYFPTSPNEGNNNNNNDNNNGGIYTSAEQRVANNFLLQSTHRKTSQQFGANGGMGTNLHSSVNMAVSGFQRHKSVQEPKKSQFGVESVFVDTSSQGYLNEAYNDNLYNSNESSVGGAFVSHQPTVPDFNRRGSTHRTALNPHSNAKLASSPSHDDLSSYNNHNSSTSNNNNTSHNSYNQNNHTSAPHTPTPPSATAGTSAASHTRRMSSQFIASMFGIGDTSSTTTAGIAATSANNDRDSAGEGMKINNVPFSKSRTGSNAPVNAGTSGTATQPRTHSTADRERDPSPASQFVASLATMNIGRNSASRVHSENLSNNIGNGGNGNSSNHSSHHNIMTTLNNGSFTNRLFRSVTVEDKKENETSTKNNTNNNNLSLLQADEESAVRNSYSAIYRNSPTGYETNDLPNPLTSDKA